VTSPRRNGLIRSTLATPGNPRTAARLAVRDLLQQQARRSVLVDGFEIIPHVLRALVAVGA
jgi:hypothetical protein